MKPRTGLEIAKINELRVHINKLFCIYGENPADFDEYVQNVLQYGIDKSLICFRDLIEQAKILYPKEWENEHKQAKERHTTTLLQPRVKVRSIYARAKTKVR